MRFQVGYRLDRKNLSPLLQSLRETQRERNVAVVWGPGWRQREPRSKEPYLAKLNEVTYKLIGHLRAKNLQTSQARFFDKKEIN